MKDPSDSARVSKFTFFWIVLFALAIVVSFFIPAGSSISERSPKVRAWATVKELLIACREYAADYGGAYPPSLEILYPDYISQEDFHLVRDHRGSTLPLIYHEGRTAEDHGALVIEHPRVFEGKRFVGYVGGHVAEVPVK